MKTFFLLFCTLFLCLLIKGIHQEQAGLVMDNEVIRKDVERRLQLQSKFKEKGNLGRYLKTHYLVHLEVK